MEKNLNISILLDFYGNVLTDKQRDAIELYYNADLSLAEIAEHDNISRQGVRDAIKHAEAILLSMEEKLGFVKYYYDMHETLRQIATQAEQLGQFNDKVLLSREVAEMARSIRDLAQENMQD